MRYYQLKYFQPQEVVPPEIFKSKGMDSLLVMDARILWTLDALRGYFAVPILVNNWSVGGSMSQRGYRTDIDMLLKTPLSQHRFGRAVDFEISGITSQQFRDKAKNGELAMQLQYITRIENDVDWCHIDCASVPGTEIVFFTA